MKWPGASLRCHEPLYAKITAPPKGWPPVGRGEVSRGDASATRGRTLAGRTCHEVIVWSTRCKKRDRLRLPST
jgi:hypothetical protein